MDIWTLPFLILGLDRLLHRRRREDLLLLAWLILGALPAALTDDRTTPHAARGLLVAPALVAIAAIGLGRAWSWVRVHGRGRRWQPLPIVVVIAIATLGTASFYRTYQSDYVVRSASWWGYGSGQALRAAGAVVPAGGQLCIATNDISGFTFTQQVLYHLPVRSYTITKGLSAPVCSKPGTILLAFTSRDLGLTVETLATIPDIRGKPLFQVVRVVDPMAGS